MTEAEKLFSGTLARWLFAWSVILGFRKSFIDVAITVADKLHSQTESLLHSLHEDPQMKDLLISESGVERPKVFDAHLAKTAAKALLMQNYGSLDAATLVFFHSVLDGTAFDYCRVTALQAPQDWEHELQNTRVPLLAAKDNSYDQMLRAKLEERMAQLERESLLAKVDRLFARCQPPSNWSPMEDYAFDRKRLEAFDEQRHAIIHGDALGRPLTLFQVTDESIQHISKTGMYLMSLVSFKYKLRPDADYISKFWQKK
jgi:hypothetical protein